VQDRWISGCGRTWYEVERQIHDIADEGLWAEAAEGALENLAKTVNGIGARLELSALRHNIGGISRDEGAVKGVQQGIL